MKKTIITLIVLGVIGAGAWHFYEEYNRKQIDEQIEMAEELIQDKEKALITVDKSHEGLRVYYPEFSSIDLVCGQQAPKDNPDAILCCAAAFTGSRLAEFKHSNIAGNHVSGGVFQKGYRSALNTGAFVWYNGSWEFLHKDYGKALKAAAENGGCAFAQNMIIFNKEVQPLYRSNSNIYRALCELEGRLCIIQSNEKISYREFVDMLVATGVTHALYLDMGGWREGWYRTQAGGKVTYLCQKENKYYTNWLTFYR